MRMGIDILQSIVQFAVSKHWENWTEDFFLHDLHSIADIEQGPGKEQSVRFACRCLRST
jgi:hypothetical protein